MRKIIYTLMFLYFMQILTAMDATEIMRKVRNREDGITRHELSVMELIDKNGDKKERVIEMWRYKYDKDNDLSKIVMEFKSPASVKDTRFMQVENKKRDDDMWIYLPALGRVRRIASSEGDSSFMGSDFTYDDMEEREVEEDKHTLLREEKYQNYDCYVVESIPVDESSSQYSKEIYWISKEHNIAVKIEMYHKKTKEKYKEYYISKELEKIDGIWTVIEMNMKNLDDNHMTKLYIKISKSGKPYIEYNKEMSPQRFSHRFLNSGNAE